MISRTLRSRSTHWDAHVAAILLAALALRLLIWLMLPYRDFISDEAEYWGAATWLAQGRGFAFFDGWIWTRPPLYLIFLALHIRLLGPTALWAPRLTQALLSVVLVYLVMRLARRLAPAGAERRVALLAGWAMALSYSFATFGYLLLSETLFITLFVAALLALLRWSASEAGWRWLALAGVLLGLCALTKAIVLTWLPLAALWLVVKAREPRAKNQEPRTKEQENKGTREQGIGERRTGNERTSEQSNRAQRSRGWLAALGPAAMLTVVVCAIVLPWSAYATLRWGGGDGLILVDTTGGYNFALGAQTGRFGQRNENALHDLLCGGVQCSIAQQSHAARQQQAYALGQQWIAEDPSGFVRKTGGELLDMIQLQYGGAERMRGGYIFGDVPLPHLLGLLWDDTLYVITVLPAIVGLWRRQGKPGKGLVVSWLLYNIVVGALVFAINRFRQPLLPFVFIYAACELVQWRAAWSSRRARRLAWSIALLFAVLILPTYLYWPSALDPNRRSVVQDTLLGVAGRRDAAECQRIEAVFRAGDVVQARVLHNAMDARIRQRGRNPNGLTCLALINARLLVAEGKLEGPDGALAFLKRAAPAGLPLQRARVLMLEGDLYRRMGADQEAIERFASRDVEVQNDLGWAWSALQPLATRRIDLGSGLDIGYIDGFYKREYADVENPFGTGSRWSGPQARLRFVGAGIGQPQTLTLRVNGYTSNPTPTTLTPQVGATTLPPITLQPDWQTVTIALPATAPGQDVIVSFSSPVFVFGPADLADRVRSEVRQPLRLFGAQFDWAELSAAQPAAGGR